MVDHEHDAHFLGGDPNGSRTEICCHCGLVRRVIVTDAPTTDHGPYLPSAESAKTTIYEDWVDPMA